MPKATLIDDEGQPCFGYFDEGVQHINYRDYDLRNAMDRRCRHWVRRWRFNQFQFISLSSSEWLLGAAIVDLKLVGTAFFYLVDLSTGLIEECSFTRLLSKNIVIEPRPESGHSAFQSGTNRLAITAEEGRRRINLNIPGRFFLDAEIDDRACQSPLSLCCRNGYQGWTYTHKNAGLPCSGTLTWQGKTFDLQTMDALASVDWSGGFMRRETAWNWASISARLPDGRRLGLNLATGVNESGFSENQLWLDGERWPITPINFQFHRDNPTAPWQLNSLDGRLNLTFTPLQCRKEKINVFLLASNFRQYIGQFSGCIELDSETLEINKTWGLIEDHYAKW